MTASTQFSPASTESAPIVYTVGTLQYDRRAVTILFGWLLWGDFAFTFFEQIFIKFMPLYLKDLQASNTLIGITTGSIAGLVNVFFLPSISQWSDRLRTKRGRRVPFLQVVTPLVILSLLGIGFAPEIAAWAHNQVTSHISPSLSLTTTTLTLLCVFSISFHFFNMILINAYNWLLRDVVPQVLMARFLSFFRIVGTLASVAFLWFVFPTMISARKITFAAIAFFYFSAFMLMCWKVREGEYPSPEPCAAGSNFLIRYGMYFRNCLSLSIYRNFFLTYVLAILATWCASSFFTLYARNSLKLSMTEMGHIWTFTAIISACAYAPVGWLCGKVSPIKIAGLSLFLQAVIALVSFFLVHSGTSWFAYSIIITIPNIAWVLTSLTLTMQLFPEKVFGQFSSGLNVLGSGGVIVGNFILGKLMDYSSSHYQYVFLWSATCFAIAIIPLYFVYRDWKKFGGPDQYTSPIPKHMS